MAATAKFFGYFGDIDIAFRSEARTKLIRADLAHIYNCLNVFRGERDVYESVIIAIDRLGTLPALVAMLVARFRRRGLLAIPVICVFFATMGALENMQEEIIPLVPVLLVLGQGLGVDAVAVVAMSVGAAMIGSAFGPTNPFQAGIALKLAQPAAAAPLILEIAAPLDLGERIGQRLAIARLRVGVADIEHEHERSAAKQREPQTLS